MGRRRARQHADSSYSSLELIAVSPTVQRIPDHSALMPANLMTLAHFAVSSTMSFSKSNGAPRRSVSPSSANRALVLGSTRAALTDVLSRLTISAGVFLGATRPCHETAS